MILQRPPTLVPAPSEGPIETTIISDDPDPLGMGVFHVKVTSLGIAIQAEGTSDWKTISFSELQLFDIKVLMADCNYLLGQYETDARDKISQLTQKLEEVRRALAVEVRAKTMRKSMRHCARTL